MQLAYEIWTQHPIKIHPLKTFPNDSILGLDLNLTTTPCSLKAYMQVTKLCTLVHNIVIAKGIDLFLGSTNVLGIMLVSKTQVPLCFQIHIEYEGKLMEFPCIERRKHHKLKNTIFQL